MIKFVTKLYLQLESLVFNTRYMKEQCELSNNRGCPTFERITLQPDGDSGWVSFVLFLFSYSQNFRVLGVLGRSVKVVTTLISI